MLYKMTKERLDLGDYGLSEGHSSGQHANDDPYVHRDTELNDDSAEDIEHDDLRGWSEDESEFDASEAEESKPEDDILNGNVLMVDQLWLWVIDTSKKGVPCGETQCSVSPKFDRREHSYSDKLSATLVTFFPKREGDLMEGPLYQQADLRDSIFNEVNADLTRSSENAMDLAALTVLHAVTVLLDRSSHPDLEVFRIFEEAISILVGIR